MTSAEELKAKLAQARAAKASSPESIRGVLGQNAAPTGATRPTLAESARESFDHFFTAPLRGVQSALFAGYDDEIAAAIAAPFSDSTYRELQQGADASKRGDYSQHPSTFMLGELVGSVPRAVVGQQLANAGYEAVKRAGRPILNTISRLGSQALVGAGDAALNAAGDDQATGPAAAIGAAFGAGGQAIGEIVGNVMQRGDPATIKEKLANRVFGSLADLDPTVSPTDMTINRQRLGPDAMVADTSPTLRSHVSGTVSTGAPASPSAVGNLADTAASRDPGEIAQDAIAEAFGTPSTLAATREANKATRKALQTEFDAAVETMRRSTLRVQPEKIVARIAESVPERPLGVIADAQNRLRKLVNVKGEFNPSTGTFARKITADDMLQMVQDIDTQITEKTALGAPAVDKDARRILVKLKTDLNDLLKDQFPEYRAITAQYAGQHELETAGREGLAALRTDSKMTVPDAMEYYNTLSESGKAAYREGMVYAIFADSEAKGPVKTMAAMSEGAKSSTVLDKVEAMFGEDMAAQLASQAERVQTYAKTNDLTEQLRSATARAMAGDQGSRGFLSEVLDVATVGILGGQGNWQSGATFGSARRMGVREAQMGSSKVNDALVEFAAQQGEDADAAIFSLYDYYVNQRKPAPLLNAGPLASLGTPPIGSGGR